MSLTIQDVIIHELGRDLLTEDGISPRVGEAAKQGTVFHHEWIEYPETPLACLMVTTTGQFVHDVGKKTLFPFSDIAGIRFKILEL